MHKQTIVEHFQVYVYLLYAYLKAYQRDENESPHFFFEEEIILSISCFKQKNIEPVQLSINLSAILWTFITDKPKQVHVVLFSVHFHSFDFALLVTYKFESFGHRT